MATLTAAQTAQQNNRHTNGEYAEKLALDPGQLNLDGEPELDDEFDWTRIESLMGNNFHLNPERTINLPKINADDNIAQMTRKLAGYVAKTQDVSDLTDDEIVDMVGLRPSPEPISDHLRAMFDVGEDERIVAAINDAGNTVLISVGNTLKRTGHFRSRSTHQLYQAENLAALVVAQRFGREFSEQYPQFDPAEVQRLLDRATDKAYSGKKSAYVWDESYLPDTAKKVIALKITPELVAADPTITSADIQHKVDRMTVEEARRILTSTETETVSVYRMGGGRQDEPAYIGTVLSSTGKVVLRQTALVSSVEADLAGDTTRAKRAAMNRAYREFLTEQLDVEYDYQLQRKYVRTRNAEHSATVFEQKKHVPQSHLDAAETGYFKLSGDFRHVEIDADTDLGKLGQVEAEYARLRKHLPRTTATPALRFRKTGRHHAEGVYHPHADNVAVDPRHPSALVHEYLHHVDHTSGARNISSSDAFRGILRRAQRNVTANNALLPREREYLNTPTETLSRSGELYFWWKGSQTSLNGDGSRYSTDPGYTSLAPMKDDIIAFWDATLTELGAEPLH